MTRQNRVLATGEIVAEPARGLFMGNRGILHDDEGRLGQARWTHKAWVTCVLKHKDRHRDILQPHHYTELFFLDEAVALAVGHRPCAMCRRADYTAYRGAAGLSGTAGEMDARLHNERAIPRTFGQRRHRADVSEMPDGAIVFDAAPLLVWKKSLRPVTPDGYGSPVAQPTGEITVLTPPTSLKALKNGYKPTLHASL